MGIQVQEHLVAAVRAVHAMDARQSRLADPPLPEQRNGDPLDRRMAAPGAGDDQQLAVAFHRRDHPVDLGRGGAIGFSR